MTTQHPIPTRELFSYLSWIGSKIKEPEGRLRLFFDDEPVNWADATDPEHVSPDLKKRGADTWRHIPAEERMESLGLSTLERRVVRVLLLQAVLHYAPKKPFCGRLSQLLPLVVDADNLVHSLQVMESLTPEGRLLQSGLVQVKGGFVLSDPEVLLTEDGIVELLGPGIFPLLGLKPFETAGDPYALPKRLADQLPENFRIDCSPDRATVLAGPLAAYCGGSPWLAPSRRFDHEVVVKALKRYGGLLVFEEENLFTSGHARELNKEVPVLVIRREWDMPKVVIRERSPRLSQYLDRRLQKHLDRQKARVSGDGQATDVPELKQPDDEVDRLTKEIDQMLTRVLSENAEA
ncbi:MAG: hypothetical protein KatS3mg015_2404 [Fimbriimonadales bacterium]|nr:MAG: hypothetical protein KatS3mg015_2404 [Fimbriimonadales bacterium]